MSQQDSVAGEFGLFESQTELRNLQERLSEAEAFAGEQ